MRGVVDGDDGVLEGALGGHSAQPDDPGGGLFGAPDDIAQKLAPVLVKLADQIATVVHSEVGALIESGAEVAVVGLIRGPGDGVGGDGVVPDQGGGHVVLRAQRVAGAQHRLGAAGVQQAASGWQSRW